jgi:hypothetical protein
MICINQRQAIIIRRDPHLPPGLEIGCCHPRHAQSQMCSLASIQSRTLNPPRSACLPNPGHDIITFESVTQHQRMEKEQHDAASLSTWQMNMLYTLDNASS